MTKEERLKKRHQAEKRWKRKGKTRKTKIKRNWEEK